MATLVDTFLEDLEDSDDDLPFTNNTNTNTDNLDQDVTITDIKKDDDDDDHDMFNDMEELMDIDKMEEEGDDLMKAPGVETVSDLLNSDRLRNHLKLINTNLNQKNSKNMSISMITDYDLIKQSNLFILEIDNHINRIHKFIRDIYCTKFPELSEMVINPIEYASCVKLFGNATPDEMNELDLRRILNNPSIAMTVHVTATTTTGKKLQIIDLNRVINGADNMLSLNLQKIVILKFVSSKMSLIAPNVSKLIGSELTAKLIGLVGGIKELSQIPSCNIQVLGSVKQNTSFLGTFQHHGIHNNNNNGLNPNSNLSFHHHYAPHFGIIGFCDLMKMVPKHLQRKALRLIASKISLCARVDAHQNAESDSSYGYKMYNTCLKKIQKWQEPPPPPPPRPLSIPDTKAKKKRGGKRYRKMRERYKITETERIRNRMAFNKQEEEIIDGNGEIIGLGMLSNTQDMINGGNSTTNTSNYTGTNRLRKNKPKTLQSKLHKIHNRQILKQKRMRMKAERAGTVSGLNTSVVFTAVQGIELSNPDLINKNSIWRNKQSKYFNQD